MSSNSETFIVSESWRDSVNFGAISSALRPRLRACCRRPEHHHRRPPLDESFHPLWQMLYDVTFRTESKRTAFAPIYLVSMIV
jgi:hypothetical protein